MYNKEDLETLELFNRKAEKLKKSSFMKFLLEQGSSVTISGNKDGRVTVDTRWPDEEARDAFVLTLRFFIQKREKSSFRKMTRVYDNLPISQQRKELFKNARKQLNDFLDAKSPMQIHGQVITRRDILKTFIYGELAHANAKKKKTLDQWMSYPIFNVTIYNEFIYILGIVTSLIANVQNLNQEVVEELGAKK